MSGLRQLGGHARMLRLLGQGLWPPGLEKVGNM